MRLRTSGDIDGAIEAVNLISGQLYSTRSGTVVGRREEWLRWWDAADRQLRSRFAGGDIATRLYRSRAEIAATSLDSRPQDVIDRETELWISRFEQLIANLNRLKLFTAWPGQIIVPDTSAFIEGVYFDQFAWDTLDGVRLGELARLVVPILVIDELDDKKRDRNHRVSRRARSVLRRQWELRAASPTDPAPIPGRNATIEVFLDNPVEYPAAQERQRNRPANPCHPRHHRPWRPSGGRGLRHDRPRRGCRPESRPYPASRKRGR